MYKGSPGGTASSIVNPSLAGAYNVQAKTLSDLNTLGTRYTRAEAGHHGVLSDCRLAAVLHQVDGLA